MKPKYKIGDKVIVSDKNHISDLKADLLANLQDRDISGALFDRANAALDNKTPMVITAIQEDGVYELSLSRRGVAIATAYDNDITPV